MKKITTLIWVCMLLLTACTVNKQQPAAPGEAGTGEQPPASTAAPSQAAGLIHMDEYVGCFANEDYDTVSIEKNGDGYKMAVSIYRLTSLEEGTVSPSSEGVVFHTVDAAENLMTVSFYRDQGKYALRIDESTWPLLEQGTVIRGLERTTAEELEARYRAADDAIDASARSGVLPPYGEGQIGFRAAVLCESLTVRQEPDEGSKAVKTLRYGEFLLVLRQENGWAECIQSDDVDASPIGWVNADYILVDPAWYRTGEKTPVFAWNDTDAPKVALLNKDVTLPILKEEGDWLLVSLRGATGWIHDPH